MRLTACPGNDVAMTVEIVYETHSWSEDNDREVAMAGCLGGCLLVGVNLPANSVSDADTTG